MIGVWARLFLLVLRLKAGLPLAVVSLTDGAEVRFWAGNDLEQYFREIDPSERQRMAYQPGDMLLS